MGLSLKDCGELLAVLRSKAVGYSYRELERWLLRAGCTLVAGKSGGSHRVWLHPQGARLPLVEPGSGPLLPVYVKRTIRILRAEEACPD